MIKDTLSSTHNYFARFRRTHNKSIQSPQWSLFWLLIGVTIIGCNSLAISPILSDLSSAFGQAASQIAKATAAYSATTALASFFIARYGENFGVRKMLRCGCLLLALGIGFSGLAQNSAMLITAQALAGLAAGVMLPSIYAMAASIAPTGKESVYVGRVITGWSLAMALGIPAMAFISDLLSWRHAYFIIAAICLAVLIGCKDLPAYKRVESISVLSTKAVLTIPNVLPTLLICLLFMLSFYGVYIFIGDYSRVSLEISASAAGLLVMAYGIGFACAAVADKYIDHFGATLSLRIVLLGVAAIYTVMLYSINDWISILITCFIWGLVNHLCLNCILVILNTADRDNKTAIMGLYTTTTYLASMIATLSFGWLYQQYAFQVLIGLSLCSCLVAVVIVFLGLRKNTTIKKKAN